MKIPHAATIAGHLLSCPVFDRHFTPLVRDICERVQAGGEPSDEDAGILMLAASIAVGRWVMIEQAFATMTPGEMVEKLARLQRSDREVRRREKNHGREG